MTQPTTPGQPTAVATSAAWRTAIRGAAVAVLLLATAGALVPGRTGRALDAAAVTVVVAAPLVRLVALAVGFLRERDGRYALAAMGLLAIVATGAIVA